MLADHSRTIPEQKTSTFHACAREAFTNSRSLTKVCSTTTNNNNNNNNININNSNNNYYYYIINNNNDNKYEYK